MRHLTARLSSILIATVLAVGLLLPLASPSTAAAAACTGESLVKAAPARFGIRVISNGRPVPYATVYVRDAETGRSLGKWQTDRQGGLAARLSDSVRTVGLHIQAVIVLPNGVRESCAFSVPGDNTAALTTVATTVRQPVASPTDSTVALAAQNVLTTLFRSQYGAEFRHIYDTVGIPIYFEALPREVFGAYDGTRIALNSWYSYNPEGLAVVLAHELTHAYQDYNGRLNYPPSADPEGCFAAEIEATVNDAYVWLSFFPNLRTPRDELDFDLNSTASLLLEQGAAGIEAMVRQSYQYQC